MRICWAQYALLATCAVLFALSLLAGCGSKGPLYLPSEQKEQEARKQQQKSPQPPPPSQPTQIQPPPEPR